MGAWRTAMTLKLSNKRFYPHLFLMLAGASIATAFSVPEGIRVTLVVSLIGVFTGFVYFLYRQHLDETKLFKELFVEFNKRYDDLNEKLNRILLAPTADRLAAEETEVLFDYFNLCAEEFLFYKAGYIDEEVWQSWRKGMGIFGENERIRQLWEKELKTESYYGFKLD